MVDLGDRNRSDERFRLAVEAAPNAMVMVNHEGKIILVNSQTEKLFGYGREELIGQSIEMLAPETSRVTHPTLRGEYLAHAQTRPMGAGRDLLAQHKNGTQFPVEIGLNPMETEDGTWVLSSIVDITERKRAEAALRESEERFRIVADTAPVMIWASGPDKKCDFFNKVWLEFTGRTLEQELGDGWAESVHPDDVSRCIATYTESFDARRSFQMEYRLLRADGEFRWILDNGVPRFTPDGVFSGYIGSCIDMTDIKRTQEEALASQKLESVGLLARGIAHDFNNLLSGILTTAELALTDRLEHTFPEQELLRIEKMAERGSEIVRQLMTYSGGESTVFEPVDVPSLVKEMLQLLTISISKNVTLETDFAAGLPLVHANPAQVRQVVMNLVTNASEAIGERRGVIRVSIGTARVGLDQQPAGAAPLAPGDYLKLAVSDTGNGMTPETQARIFDPFFTTKGPGRGLGLAAVHGIVRSHSGAINVVSSLIDGTRFEILLPCANEPVPVVLDSARPTCASEPAKLSGTVLVVEDEDPLRGAVSEMIRRAGLKVIEAAEGSAAVDYFRAYDLDIVVVLLDMTLPGMQGPEVLANLRRVRPDVKVILTTAYSQEMISASLDREQPWAFIRKPYRFGKLMGLLRDACRQHRETSDPVTD